MSIVRVNKNTNFTVMSNYHFKEKKMSLKAKGLLSLMLSLPDDWNYSVTGLVKLSKDGKDSVMAGLKELENFGFLIRTRMTDEKGRFDGYEYNIFEEPQGIDPNAENPNSDKPNTGKTNAENPPQLNTKKSKTNKSKTKVNKNSLEQYEETLSNIVNESLRNLYVDYIEMRRIINAPMTPRALTMLITRVERLAPMNISKQKELLENAILNNWKNVYLPFEQKSKEKKTENGDFMNKMKSLYDQEN